MVKVVYNVCFGGFSLSDKAREWLKDRGREIDLYDDGISRHCKLLVECVETLGDAASGGYAELAVETIEGNRYMIDEYDGSESVLTPAIMEKRWIVVNESSDIDGEIRLEKTDGD